jgi:formyltetrahydrofolate deformylase
MASRHEADGRYVLTLTCDDRVGIVAAVSGTLADIDAFIVSSQQYADLASGRFFMRVAFVAAGARFPGSLAGLRDALQPVAARFVMDWDISDSHVRPRVLIAVSKAGHCLNDLLHRWRTGALPIDVAGVVSNHEDMRDLTEWHRIGFHYLPVAPTTKAAQEAKFADLIDSLGIDFVVLARYMQVLSPDLVSRLPGRCINIHHSFLPSFKGARPYARALARGVKLIGATAHYVTSELDEGPIIEQDVARVDHRATERDMVNIGRDVEAQVLARAVRWQAERRILLNGNKTVVFV